MKNRNLLIMTLSLAAGALALTARTTKKSQPNLQTVPKNLRSALTFGVLATELWMEHQRPLRDVTQPKPRRVTRNLLMAAISNMIFSPLVDQVTLRASREVSKRGIGLFRWAKLPRPVEVALAILALDYLEYWWHVLNHRNDFFWRFHNPHHVDLNMDVSTATRFHFGELFFSSIVQTGKITLLGVDPFTFTLYMTLLVSAAQFHHSNIRLPLKYERILNRVIVTPRMHGVHHSIVESETDSNWGIIFSFWDRLHQTMKLNIPNSEIEIGVAPYRNPNELTLAKLLMMPFGKQRDWKLPEGTYPQRLPSEVAEPGKLAA